MSLPLLLSSPALLPYRGNARSRVESRNAARNRSCSFQLLEIECRARRYGTETSISYFFPLVFIQHSQKQPNGGGSMLHDGWQPFPLPPNWPIGLLQAVWFRIRSTDRHPQRQTAAGWFEIFDRSLSQPIRLAPDQPSVPLYCVVQVSCISPSFMHQYAPEKACKDSSRTNGRSPRQMGWSTAALSSLSRRIGCHLGSGGGAEAHESRPPWISIVQSPISFLLNIRLKPQAVKQLKANPVNSRV